MWNRTLLAIVILLAAGRAASAQAVSFEDGLLPRRTQLGASLGEVTDSLARLGEPRGARVLGVLPASAAVAAGLRAGDVIVRIGRDTVTSVAGALAAVRPLVAGAHVALVVVRARRARTLSFVARERARERSPDFDIVYMAVRAPGEARRVLLAHPRDGVRHPAVLLVGGIGCYSIDQAEGPSAYRDLMYHLTRRGFTTIRVEKAGVGDSEGGPCAETDFETELAGYAAALAAARSSPWVDPARIVLLGHSIGGIEAPLLAARDTEAPPLRGIVVLSTVGIRWYEYELANLRRQLRLQHLAPDSIERAMALKVTCGYRFLLQRETRSALLATEPRCAPYIAYPASDAYMQQVAAHDPASAWKPVTAPALVLWGTSDFITSRDEHVQLAEALNRMHRGQATFAEVPELDHYLSRQASQEASLRDPVPGLLRPYYGATLEPVLDAWLAALSGVARN